eukprot:TRINITY_DN2706_c0_g1_i1.p1 TRINITY_DN2706_c0_g1~~TRINITY_DN2706_c0_g1_i1.p1  ORF type:complete len:106 (-),score=17.43 TRINITY_DN2706_c0_g1_i1:43-360(-)
MQGVLNVDIKETESINQLRSVLQKTMSIKITDGRVMVGKFCCIDNGGNIILGETIEKRTFSLKTKDHPEGVLRQDERGLGLVVIPGKHVIECLVDDNSVQSNETS